MAKDLIIGAAVNYNWDQIKYWVNSIRDSGFAGDVALVGTNLKAETIKRLTEEGVILSLYGNMDEEGNIVSPQNNAPHVERFFYLWNFLASTTERYGNVITTDVRDVVFQSNPTEWLDENMPSNFIAVSSEGMRYKNEPWGNRNLLETFGPYFHNRLCEDLIFNVGVIAGEMEYVKGLLSFIFHLSVNRPIQIVDQAVFNFILHQSPFDMDALSTTNIDGWAIQLGTTIHAVESGKGDLGLMFKNTPSLYHEIYEDVQPVIDGDTVKTPEGVPYVIVHQYDRVDGLREMIEQKYGERK